MFITAGVVATTLVVQGLLLPRTVRWAHLPTDDRVQRERRFADQAATEAALDALPRLAADLSTDPVVVDGLRGEYDDHLRVLLARDSATVEPDDTRVRLDEQYTALRLALLSEKRATVIRLRDERHIDDAVLRQIQARLDIEEVRLSRGELA